MTNKERWHFFLTWLALGVIPLFLRPLWQPDEGRYAEIPREMLASGDWLTPYLNYAPYFEKPPFQYWLSAIFMKLFGESAPVARLPLALASLITMYAAYLLAKRLGSDKPVWASFVAVSCLLLYSCGQILTLDALFSSLCVFSLAAAVEAVSLRYYAKSDPKKVIGWTLAFFAIAGCALLTKGLVVIVIVGGAFSFSFFFAWKDAKLRSAVLRTLFSPYGWLFFFLITVPWFVMVNIKNPGHAHYFFYEEHFERFTTQKHARQGSDNPILDKLYFVPVILAGVLPWLSACFVGTGRAMRFIVSKGPSTPDGSLNKWIVVSLLFAFAWPVLFFSAAGSKLIPYVLPCIVPLIAVAIAFERHSDGFRPFKRAGVEMLSLGTLFLITALYVVVSNNTSSPGWVADLQSSNNSESWLLFLGMMFVLVGFWGIKGYGLTAPRWMAWHATMLLFITITAQQIAGPNSSINHLIVKVPTEIYGKIQWISYGDYYQVLPFLVKNRIVTVGATGELMYGKGRLEEHEQNRWFIEDRVALTETALKLQVENPDKPIWALSSKRAWSQLPPESKNAWRIEASSPNTLLISFQNQHSSSHGDNL